MVAPNVIFYFSALWRVAVDRLKRWCPSFSPYEPTYHAFSQQISV